MEQIMTEEEYKNHFSAVAPSNEGKSKAHLALEFAMDIRKFEIDLYWKRATYFWTFIAAAFAGYALVFTKAEDAHFDKSWALLVFSCLGLLFSVAWYLVNRGSKFWQNNWECHVDLLEDEVIGPLYKTIAHSQDGCNLLIAAKQYSVSKINQILSFFVSCFWVVLIAKSIFTLPISPCLSIDWYKTAVLLITLLTVICLFVYGASKNTEKSTVLTSRKLTVESK
jgi:4-amino-4-deoxy-L-arabinose transferase-like glycosyltransferase